jgi:type III secretion protein V
VTRVAGEEEGGTLGGDLARQLLSDPRPLAAVSALLAALALVPGLPAGPFLALATATALGARRAAGLPAAAPAVPGSRRPAEAAASGASQAPLAVADDTSPVVLEAGTELVALLAGDPVLRELPARAAEALWKERGVRLEALPVRAAALEPASWRLVVDEVPVAEGALDAGRLLALADPADLELAGIAGVPAREPFTGHPATLVVAADAARAEALGPVRSARERLGDELAEALVTHAHLLVGVQEVQLLLEALEASAPALVREVARVVPAAALAEVLRRLLEEQVSIRPLRVILQALLEGPERETAALAAACRRALRRHIAHRCAPAGELAALLLDPAAELRLREALRGELLAVAPDVLAQLLAEVAAVLDRDCAPRTRPVLVAAGDLRRPLRQLVSARFPALPVLCWDELPPDLRVRPLARIPAAA